MDNKPQDIEVTPPLSAVPLDATLNEESLPVETPDDPTLAIPASVGSLPWQHEPTLLPPDPSDVAQTLLPSASVAFRSAKERSVAEPSATLASVDEASAPTPSTPGPTLRQQSVRDTQPAPHANKKGGFPNLAGYEIIEELGRGGMGVVYKARQPGLNRLVALKMILRGRGTKKERALFQLEAEVLAKLQHPHIVQIFEIREVEGELFFVLEFVEGGCLADLIGTKDAPTPRASAHIVQQLAEGMAVAHAQGIVHRDLKPANVLIADCGLRIADSPKQSAIRNPQSAIPKITDFGLAKLVVENESAENSSAGVMGTPSYMPPEQAEGRNWQVGPPADIYALGAILYDLLAGTPPFRGTTLFDTLRMVCQEKPRPPREFNPAIPHDLQVICLKCLEKNPADRYGSACELAADLGAFLEGSPLRARSYSRGERVRLWARRKPLGAALLLVSVLGLLGLGLGGVVIAEQQRSLALAEARRAEEQADNAQREKELRQAEERERQRAEANLDEAREAVAELTQLGHQRLAGAAHMDTVRREILEKALTFYRRFLAINGDRPGQRHEVARAQARVAEIEEMLGKLEAARTAYLQARDALLALVEAAPDCVVYRRDLATTWNDLAILQQAMNQPGEAEKSFAEALRLRKELPRRPELVRDLVSTLTSRGTLRLAMRKPQEAERDYLAGLRLLADLPPKQAQEGQARLHSLLAALWTTTQPAQATAAYDKAIQAWSALVKLTPGEPKFQHELASVHANRGFLREQLGQTKDAETDYAEATRLFMNLTGQFRSVVAYREALAETYLNHALFLKGLGRFAEAEKVWRASLPLWQRLIEDVPGKPAYRRRLAQSCDELAIALASTNRFREVESLWEEAIALQEQLVKEQPQDAEAWQGLVNSSANRAALLKELPLTERTEKAARQLVDVQQRRARVFDGVAAYQSDWGAALALLAEVLVKQNRLDDAARSLGEAVAHAQAARAVEPKVSAYEQAVRDHSLTLVELQLRTNKHEEARRVLGELLKALPATRSKSHRVAPEQAALVLVRCLSAASADTTLTEMKRSALRAEYGAAAVTLLRQALAEGFRELQQTDWKPLAEREDFRKLLAQPAGK